MRLAAALMLAGASAAAQPPADFSGKWQLVPDTSAPANSPRSVPPMGAGWGSDITITQDATTLAIEFATYGRYDMQPPTRLVYRLDGSESKNTLNTGRGPQEQVSKAAWDKTRLTLTTTRSFSEGATGTPASVTTTQMLSLESPGMLVVETTHGAALGGKPLTSRSVYKKS
jgi:hypothetical protein